MSQRDVAAHFCVDAPLCVVIIQEVCQRRYERFVLHFYGNPPLGLEEMQKEFNNQWNFPHCLVLDGGTRLNDMSLCLHLPQGHNRSARGKRRRPLLFHLPPPQLHRAG
ncbi:hypothetical protein GWK47_012689 [Chionoecetes opilio]|uniref:Uncharacterized protein n=1 Tax=Chionoecetes opilio TaxID=41210 RepID=A0A8J4XWQ1_CHIOP|nr:hypothetical protein GWK47_012689 [Chionoecetes opilio]